LANGALGTSRNNLKRRALTFHTDRSVAVTGIDRRTSFKGIAALAASAVVPEAACSEKPLAAAPDGAPLEPVTTGPSQTQGMARFASRTRFENLTAERRHRLKIALLDSLACGIGTLEAPPMQALLAQTKAFGSDARCTLIGGGQANVVYAGSYNAGLVRYLDYMDSYLAGAELCHPSDNTGGVLAVCEHAGRSGKEFLTALAVAYQVEPTLTGAADFMARGFDLTTQLTFSLGAGVAKALELDEEQATSAIGICASSGVPLLVARTTPISQWKGLLPGQLTFGSIQGAFLASRGVTGPKYVIEGPEGLAHALGQPIKVDWDLVQLDCFDRLALKSYNSAVPTQSALFCMLELRRAYPFNPATVASIQADVFQDAYDFTGGGKFGPKTKVHTKEDADHSLPYLLAVAAIDGEVHTTQLTPQRITRPDVQSLLLKVQVRPNAGFTARYPAEMPARVTVLLTNGQSHTHEVKDYPGFPTRPFTWDDVVTKFDRLVGDRADAGLRKNIQAAVLSLESIQVEDLMNLLGQVGSRGPVVQ
jgi:2-methylcitrate dehydratase